MTEPQQASLRDITDKYSPIVKGRTGLAGLAFKAAARTVELAGGALNAATQWAYPRGFENAAGQMLSSGTPAAIIATYQRMESKLRASFAATAAKFATPGDRQNFLALAAEVKQDAEILAPHTSVLRSEFDIVTEPYKFILVKATQNAPAVTLEQGIEAVTEALNRKNPVTIRRKPVEMPKPDTGKTAVGF